MGNAPPLHPYEAAIVERRKTDADSTWHPEEGANDPEALLKLTNIAARDIARLRADRDADRAVLTRVAESVDGLNSTLARLVRLLAWAGGISGGCIVVALTMWGIGVFGRVRIDPPTLPPVAAPR